MVSMVMMIVVHGGGTVERKGVWLFESQQVLPTLHLLLFLMGLYVPAGRGVRKEDPLVRHQTVAISM